MLLGTHPRASVHGSTWRCATWIEIGQISHNPNCRTSCQQRCRQRQIRGWERHPVIGRGVDQQGAGIDPARVKGSLEKTREARDLQVGVPWLLIKSSLTGNEMPFLLEKSRPLLLMQSLYYLLALSVFCKQGQTGRILAVVGCNTRCNIVCCESTCIFESKCGSFFAWN